MTFLSSQLKLIVLTSLIVLSQSAWAQKVLCPRDLRRMQQAGIWAAEVWAGPKDWKGVAGSVGVIHYFKKSEAKHTGNLFPTFLAKLNGNYALDELNGLQHQAISLDITGGYTPTHLFGRVYPTFIAGVGMSNDAPTIRDNDIPSDVHNSLIKNKAYGIVGIEVLIFPASAHWAFVLHADQRYLTPDIWGDKRQYFGAGFRYHFHDMNHYTGRKIMTTKEKSVSSRAGKNRKAKSFRK